MASEGKRHIPAFKAARELSHNRVSKKVAIEASLSVVTAIPLFWSIGPATVGSINLFNAATEAFGVVKGKEDRSLGRALMYASCGAFEFGLQYVGLSFLRSVESDALHYAGLDLPGVVDFVGGTFSSGAIGLVTGMFTNTIWYEAKRKGLIPYTPLDVILRRK